ncbi:hypothetical protein SALBM135S_03268 [Streptomyces alboniger]
MCWDRRRSYVLTGGEGSGERGRERHGAGPIRRWESGALAHAVSDPFGQGPLPWLRGSEHYFDDTGQVVPWYVDHASAPGANIPATRTGGPLTADDVRRQIKGFTSTGAAAPGEAIDFHVTVDPPRACSPHRDNRHGLRRHHQRRPCPDS